MRVIFLILLFTIANFFNLSAQELNFSQNTEPQEQEAFIDFKIKNLVELPQDTIKYSGLPFYQAFTIFGDGNFQRYGNTAAPINGSYNFSYPYRNLENKYPALSLMIARKDDEDPPDLDKMILTPPGSPDNNNNQVEVNSKRSSPNGPIYSINVEDGRPLVPMIAEGSDAVLSMGLSHYSPFGGYFLEEKTVHAFPIAYKPVGAGILFFFYENDDASLVKEEFEYFKEIKIETENGNGITSVGTLLPNYFHSADNLLKLTDRMTLNEFQVGGNDWNMIMSTADYFDRGIAYNIPQAEADLINDPFGVRLSPSGNSSIPGELRLFHFIKTGIFKSEGTARFLAVLYDSRGDINESRFNSLVRDPNNLSFPNTISVFSGMDTINENSYRFADYFILTANKGEPNDPGGLIIEEIHSDGDEYVVDFKLTFCNAETAGATATEASIFLESYPVDDPINNPPPLFTDFQLISECVIPILSEDGIDCRRNDDLLKISKKIKPDTTYYYSFESNGLSPGECGAIQFSARINASEIDRLTTEHVMRYCVKFNESAEIGEFCLPNEIIQDTICIKNSNDTLIICNANPIWTDKDEGESLIGVSGPPYLMMCLGAVIGFFCIFILKRKKHKKRRYKKY